MTHEDGAQSASPVEDLLQHALAGVRLAESGLRQARQEDARELIELFEHALASYNRCADAARQRLQGSESAGDARPAEQVTSASFAPGDGATDADVLPEGQQNRAGNWPAY